MDTELAQASEPTLLSFVVGQEFDARGRMLQPSLLSLADIDCRCKLSDLRRLNPAIADTPADAPLPLGTAIRLPFPLLDQRYANPPEGGSFCLAEMEARLQRSAERLDAIATCWRAAAASRSKADYGQPPLPVLPQRQVRSPLEQLRCVVDAETERQLPSVAERYAAAGERDTKLALLVDAGVVKAKADEIVAGFAAGVSLRCYEAENSLALGTLLSAVGRRGESVLCEPDLHTVHDAEADTCTAHTHRWEVVLLRAGSDAFMEEWAVLACQRLTTFIDAVKVTCLASTECGWPVAVAQDAMLYIDGVFYVDDRHSDHRDLSADIRRRCAITLGDGRVDPKVAAQNVFADCPVRSASSTRWGDLTVRRGELCVLHHLGGGTHQFYLNGPRALATDGLNATPRVHRDQYPHRTAKRKEAVTLCQLCRTYPSTVALLHDPLSPTNPAYYCAICNHLLHGNERASPKPYIEVRPRNPGGYFTK